MTNARGGGWIERRWLAVAGGLGVTSAVAQVVLLRELLVGFRGNELSLGISLAAWLLWVAIGSAVGGLWSRRGPAAGGDSGASVALTLLILGALPSLSIWFARDLRAILHVGWGEFIPTSRLVYAVALLVAPVGLAAGAAFPAICRAAMARARIPPGRVYLFESLGFLVGGLITFGAADRLLPFVAALAAAAIGGAAGLLAMWHSRVGRWATAAWVAAACAGIVAGAPARLESASLRNLYPGQRIIASAYSRYGTWVALAHAEQVSFYHNGALAFAAPQPMAAETLAHLAVLQRPNPRRALLIGGGLDGTAAELLKHPGLRLDYVELDPAVIALAHECARSAAPHLTDFMQNPRLRFSRIDGRLFLKRATGRYDLIIVNLPEPSTALLNRFYTVEFFAEARRALTENGVLCIGLPGAENYIGPEMQALHGSAYHSLRRVFADVAVTPGDYSYFFASRRAGMLSVDAAELARRWQHEAVPVKYFGPYYIEAILLPERVEFIRQSCESAPRSINHDFRPVGYFHDVALAGLSEGLLPPGLAARVHAISIPVLAVVALGLFGLPALASRRGERLLRAAIIGGIGVVGLAGMTLEVSLLFALQVINGHVYAQVGALIAAFMAGLAVGTWWSSSARVPVADIGGDLADDAQVIRAQRVGRGWLMWLIVGIVVCAVTPALVLALQAVPPTASWLPTVIIALLMMAGGAVVGALFPIAVRLLGQSARTAGSVYAADLAGAGLGAIITALFALPLLGLAGTCYGAAAMIGMASVIGVAALSGRRQNAP
jgi:spermidine synthase